MTIEDGRASQSIMPGTIIIAGSKRRSIAMQMGGMLYRVGRIAANDAFVLVCGTLRFLYVSPGYKNYRYAARRVFGGMIDGHHVDHVLGRKLTETHGFMYTLLAVIDGSTNCAHGASEIARPLSRVVLDKFAYFDDRILRKTLGLAPTADTPPGYELVRSHARAMSDRDTARVRHALGMDGVPTLCSLRPIAR